MQEGERVGAYRITQRVGAGGMGEVWLAHHEMLGRRAAIKVLNRELTANPDIVRRFFNEARSAASIPDPGIVQIFDFGHDNAGNAYIVMELLVGEPLDARLRTRRRLEIGDAVRIMRQVASTVGAAHALGIVHRDLKPENVFVVKDPEVPGGERAKVLDFGIAKLAAEPNEHKTSTFAVMGTPMYMSPEQCRGAGLVDARADIYSLGCVFYSLLVGHPPFIAEGAGDLIAMHLREPPPIASHQRAEISAEIDALIARCLAKDPNERFATGSELAAALGTLVLRTSEPVLAIPPSQVSASIGATTTLSSSASYVTAPIANRRGSLLVIAVGVALLSGGVIVAVLKVHASKAVESISSSLDAADAAPLPDTRAELLAIGRQVSTWAGESDPVTWLFGSSVSELLREPWNPTAIRQPKQAVPTKPSRPRTPPPIPTVPTGSNRDAYDMR